MSIYVNQFVKPRFEGCVENNNQLNEKLNAIKSELDRLATKNNEMQQILNDKLEESKQNYVPVSQFNELVQSLNETMLDLETNLNCLLNSTPRDMKNLNVKIEELQNEILNMKNINDIIINEDKQSIASAENPIRAIPKIRITKTSK